MKLMKAIVYFWEYFFDPWDITVKKTEKFNVFRYNAYGVKYLIDTETRVTYEYKHKFRNQTKLVEEVL